MTYKCSKVCELGAVYCDKNEETKKYVQNFGSSIHGERQVDRYISGVPWNFVRGGVQQIQLRTEQGSGGGSPLVRDSGIGCNLVQEISFHEVKFS